MEQAVGLFERVELGLLVDAVSEVIEIPAEAIEPATARRPPASANAPSPLCASAARRR